MDKVNFVRINESAIMLDFGDSIDLDQNKKILQLAENISNNRFDGLIECVPAYTTLTIYFDPLKNVNSSEREWMELLHSYLDDFPSTSTTTKLISVPVCYDKEFGLDLQEVALYHQISVEKVIELHTNPTYHVYFLGFSPGFPFLGGMDSRLATPRKQTPRVKITAGSVGIAGQQTGIYPSQTPGGWQIIGRTPVSLIDLKKDSPTFLKPGDRLKFKAISKEQYEAYLQGELLWGSE